MKELILAIAIIESSLNPLAIGDNGESVGLLQISKPVVQDVNYFFKKNYTYEDRADPKKSQEIFYYYIKKWGNHYTNKTNKPLTTRVVCDLWNGGATAPYRKENNPKLRRNLDLYYSKVKNILDTQIH